MTDRAGRAVVRRAVLFAALVAPLGSGRAPAQTLPVLAIDRQVYAAFDATHLAYDEHLAPPAISDAEHGWTPGFDVGARWNGAFGGLPSVYVGLDYHRQSGHVRYTGADFDTGLIPLRGQSGLVTDDVSAEVGHVFVLAPTLAVVPMVQFGYHHWTRRIALDEVERYSHGFGGVAVRLDAAVTPRLVASGRVGLAGTISPQVDIGFRGERTLGLGDSVVYQAGGRLDYAVAGPIHAFVGIDFDRFGYGVSGDAPLGGGGRIYEPSSTTTRVSTSIGVGYAF